MTHEILDTNQMARADQLTIQSGTEGYSLMTQAGQGITECVQSFYPGAKILVLAGPGNNGGDGFVAARMLKDAGYKVSVACLVPLDKLKDDAHKAAKDWGEELYVIGDKLVDNMPFVPGLVIDALFGTGLSKPLRPPVTDILEWVRNRSIPVLAVDIPSGIYGESGEADPNTLCADHTVTFFRKKLGHLLQPGRSYCGRIQLHDIGIGSKTLEQTGCAALENHPDLWLNHYPQPVDNSHKYQKGVSVIYGGKEMTGAASMASAACMRVGSGLCFVLAEFGAGDLYRTILPPHIIVREDPYWTEDRISARLIGPGAGSSKNNAVDKLVDHFLSQDTPVVLDADSLTELRPFSEHVVLTPHDGEFKRLCPDASGNRLEKALYATEKTDAVIVLKGNDTVIAQKGRKPVINTHTSPVLATAGTGDVLAGMITGLLAQGMEAFDAACAAVWLHGDAARKLGPGCVAPDIPDILPEVLNELLP